ncbi:hypothetical protein [Devosia sp.]|uniref:hypothetical protein n=1 Tax=Devosia sp. TaxID=1871048 RepID=UPI003F70F995
MGVGLGQIGGLGHPRLTRGGKSLASLLFGNGEDGFLFGDFAELDELFTAFSGPPAVAADNDPVGLALDDATWAGRTLLQQAALSPELKGTGSVGKVGTAPDATYDTVSGVVSASRVADGGNQSYMTMGGLTAGAVYLIDATPLPNGFAVRDTATGFIATSFVGGVRQQQIVRPSTTSLFFTNTNNNTTAVFTVHSVKRIPGNHAAQSTAANRPFWKANAGRPYLSFDGVNDGLVSSFLPNAASGLTLAVAFNCLGSAGTACMLGGGTPTGDRRAFIALTSIGTPTIGWGTQVNSSGIGGLNNQNHVLLLKGTGAARTVWLDGIDVTTNFAATVSSPDGSGGALTLAARQSTPGGGLDLFFPGNLFAAVVVNREVTATEVARISSDFQRTF